jgi:hypothetical protein
VKTPCRHSQLCAEPASPRRTSPSIQNGHLLSSSVCISGRPIPKSRQGSDFDRFPRTVTVVVECMARATQPARVMSHDTPMLGEIYRRFPLYRLTECSVQTSFVIWAPSLSYALFLSSRASFPMCVPTSASFQLSLSTPRIFTFTPTFARFFAIYDYYH